MKREIHSLLPPPQAPNPLSGMQRSLIGAADPQTQLDPTPVQLLKSKSDFVQTNLSMFIFFFFVVFLSNHLKTTLANWHMKVEKLTNLPVRTVAKQCASEPEDEVQVFPEITQDSNCHLGTVQGFSLFWQRYHIHLYSQVDNRSFSLFFFLTSKHHWLKKRQSHKCFTWSQSH